MEGLRVFIAPLAACLVFGCTAEDPVDREVEADAGVGPYLSPPVLDPTPETTSLGTVAIRGLVDGDRVMVRGTSVGSTIETPITGSFCFDLALSDDGPTEFEVFALGGNGTVSQPTLVTVTKDAAAPAPPNATCSGMAGPSCEPVEVCSNEADDDCDGFEPECDSDCNGCNDDAYEPNDEPIDVPILSAGTHFLNLCPCRDDWFAFSITGTQRIRATANFVEDEINVGMRLYRANPGGAGTEFLVQTSSTFDSDTESIDYLVTTPGLYYLRVHDLLSDDSGSYTLTIE